MSGVWGKAGALMIARGRQMLLFWAVLSSLVSLALAHTARAGGVQIRQGALSQLPGGQGCVSATATDGCRVGRQLAGAFGVAVSGDGHNVYVAANSTSAVLTFARDPSTGGLTQLPGGGGCTSESGAGGCATGSGLTGAVAVTVSGD